jgi:hypothetical protein
MRVAGRRYEELEVALVHTFALCLGRLVAGPVNCAVLRSAGSRSYGHWQSSSMQAQRQQAHAVRLHRPGRVVWVVRGFCLCYIRVRKVSSLATQGAEISLCNPASSMEDLSHSQCDCLFMAVPSVCL